jgi:hypothetical protein
MIALTPEQMRAQADRISLISRFESKSGDWLADLLATTAALRAAADQLEAVPAQREAFLDSPMLDGMWIAGWHAAIDHVTHLLTADTAPQETTNDR